MTKVLFICTGNTCRSPMAEGIFNAKAKRLGVDAAAVSCGISADIPQMVTDKAETAAKRYGADISGHISRAMTAELLDECDFAYCMTLWQVKAVKVMFPEFSQKIFTLSPSDISDPYGGGQAEYDRAASEIEAAVAGIIERIKND